MSQCIGETFDTRAQVLPWQASVQVTDSSPFAHYFAREPSLNHVFFFPPLLHISQRITLKQRM